MTGEASTICQLNDAHRRNPTGGRVHLTVGVAAMPSDRQSELIRAVETFDAFTADNDPHGEHDFGAIDQNGRRFFWKIDCYDRGLRHGSPDPANPKLTCRVLTIMRAEEY